MLLLRWTLLLPLIAVATAKTADNQTSENEKESSKRTTRNYQPVETLSGRSVNPYVNQNIRTNSLTFPVGFIQTQTGLIPQRPQQLTNLGANLNARNPYITNLYHGTNTFGTNSLQGATSKFSPNPFGLNQVGYNNPYNGMIGGVSPFPSTNFGSLLLPTIGTNLQQPGANRYNSNRPLRNNLALNDPRTVVILSQRSANDGAGNYNFQYETANGIRRQEFGSPVGLNSYAVRGSYSYTSPEGIPVVVNYLADENGFRVDSPNLSRIPHLSRQQILAAQAARRSGILNQDGSYQQSFPVSNLQNLENQNLNFLNGVDRNNLPFGSTKFNLQNRYFGSQSQASPSSFGLSRNNNLYQVGAANLLRNPTTVEVTKPLSSAQPGSGNSLRAVTLLQPYQFNLPYSSLVDQRLLQDIYYNNGRSGIDEKQIRGSNSGSGLNFIPNPQIGIGGGRPIATVIQRADIDPFGNPITRLGEQEKFFRIGFGNNDNLETGLKPRTGRLQQHFSGDSDLPTFQQQTASRLAIQQRGNQQRFRRIKDDRFQTNSDKSDVKDDLANTSDIKTGASGQVASHIFRS